MSDDDYEPKKRKVKHQKSKNQKNNKSKNSIEIEEDNLPSCNSSEISIEDEKDSFQEFRQNLAEEGFILFNISLDGNCLFRAVAHQLENNVDNHMKYRKKVVKYISQRSEHFEGFITHSEGGLSGYLVRMGQSGTWGGNCELIALSEVENIRIEIIKETNERIIIGDEKLKTIYLAYHERKQHYMSIRKIEDPERSEGKQEEDVLEEEIKEEKHSQINPQRNGKEIEEKKDEKLKIDFRQILLLDIKGLILWCLEQGLIFKPDYCPKCRSKGKQKQEMRLSGHLRAFDKFIWRCKNRECSEKVGIRERNRLLQAFPRTKLNILLVCIFTHFALLMPPTATSQALGLSFQTIKNIADLLNRWIVEYQKSDEILKGQFGGRRSIIEMDESCFFKRKNHKGRTLEQIWGLGFVERETGRLYVEIVPDRKARTLLPIIRRWIKESTSLVITDEWKSYSRLVKMGYNHRTIKHKKNFVDPNDPRIYTQTIENRWGQIKSLMKKRGRISRISFDQKVKEMTWRIMNRTNLQEKLLEVIKINIK